MQIYLPLVLNSFSTRGIVSLSVDSSLISSLQLTRPNLCWFTIGNLHRRKNINTVGNHGWSSTPYQEDYRQEANQEVRSPPERPLHAHPEVLMA